MKLLKVGKQGWLVYAVALGALAIAVVIVGALVGPGQSGEGAEAEAMTKVMASSAKLTADNKTDQAIAELQKFVDTAKNNENKVQPLIQIGQLNASKQEWQKSLDAFRKAEEYANPVTPTILAGIAQATDQLKEYKTAIDYYNRLISGIDAKDVE